MLQKSSIRVWTAVALIGLSVPVVACAAEKPLFLNAPASKSAPATQVAVQFGLTIRLPDGRGLARALIDAGVDRDDAGRAAKLAAGHLGDHAGGCSVKVSIAKGAVGSPFRLVRIALTTQATQTVIERRGDELSIASHSSLHLSPPIV